jgi:hypothetical protein
MPIETYAWAGSPGIAMGLSGFFVEAQDAVVFVHADHAETIGIGQGCSIAPTTASACFSCIRLYMSA